MLKKNIWVDDLRPAPAGWEWVKTSQDAINHLAKLKASKNSYAVISLDHDLGGDDTTRRVILWIIEQEFFPQEEIRIHTANPVGRDYLKGTAERHFPPHVKVWS